LTALQGRLLAPFNELAAEQIGGEFGDGQFVID